MELNELAQAVSKEAVVGFAIAAVLVSALLWSPLFRNFALAAAATGIVYLYVQQGLTGIHAIADKLTADAGSEPDLLKGLYVGLAAMFAVFSISMLRRT